MLYIGTTYVCMYVVIILPADNLNAFHANFIYLYRRN